MLTGRLKVLAQAVYSPPAPAKVKLRQLQVAWLRNLQINLRTVDCGDGISSPFDDGGFVGAHKAIGKRFGEGLLQQSAAEALRRLRQNDVLARDGGGDEGPVRGALDLPGRPASFHRPGPLPLRPAEIHAALQAWTAAEGHPHPGPAPQAREGEISARPIP